MSGFDTVLVANRGEIACRVIRSARAMGVRTVAVYTDADAGAPHVALADQAVNIGAGPATESYLSVDKLLSVAAETGAGAVHPGYGFLSENAGFAQAVAEAGRVFVGPSAEVIALMGDKAAAKARMAEAGVPCVPGYQGPDQSPDRLRAEAEQIGYPVMIKATAGGGGRGMRRVDGPDAFDAALALARTEAQAAFGSDAVILEKALRDLRHVEVQVFGDSFGTVIHLGERDCSVQRRHQKIIEEAPCPVLNAKRRAEIGAAAVEAARAIGYVGAGTVEFLLDDAGFYFLEMNTRLQVEHPVTELITGQDLVALQLQVAMGQPLGLLQADVELRGHAIEARLYAEDPDAGFLPSTGHVERWASPHGPGLRVDAGLSQGQDISPFYDPMLAKIIAHGTTRAEALTRLRAGLRDTVLFGPVTNRDFLLRVLRDPVFESGEVNTDFLDAWLLAEQGAPVREIEVALAAALAYRHDQARFAAQASDIPVELLGWSSRGRQPSPLWLRHRDQDWRVRVLSEGADRLCVHVEDTVLRVSGHGELWHVDGTRIEVPAHQVDAHGIWLVTGTSTLHFTRPRAGVVTDSAAQSGVLRAPMHGVIQSLLVQDGQNVVKGDTLAVLEAMKMQHPLTASVSGTVRRITVAAGDQVQAGGQILDIKEGDTDAAS